MGRTRPLAIDDFMKIVGIADIRRSQTASSREALRGLGAPEFSWIERCLPDSGDMNHRNQAVPPRATRIPLTWIGF
jgi:hypothetical protein